MKNETFIDERLKAHFLSLYCLVVSDDNVHPKELEMLYKIGIEYGISENEINAIVLQPNNALVAPNTIEEKVAYLFNLTRIAYADGKIVPEERSLIIKYAIKFGFPEEKSDLLVDYFYEKVKDGKVVEEILNELK